MADEHRLTDDQYAALQREHGGRYVARRGTEVIASSRTLGGLIDHTDQMVIDWTGVVIEYVEQPDRIRIYAPRVRPNV